MYKVLIVDTDPNEINILSSLINWEENGLKIIGSLSDSRQALTFLEENAADILIVGISYPHLDGISLLQQIRSRGISTRCILSADRPDFSYVQKTIPLGIENFFLKPVEPQILLDTLHATIQKLQYWSPSPFCAGSNYQQSAKDNSFTLLMSQQFEDLMLNQEYQKCLKYLDQLFSSTHPSQSDSLILRRNHVIELVTCVLNVMLSYNIDTSNAVGDSAMLFYNILSLNDIHDLHTWMQGFMYSAINALENKALHFSPCIDRVVALIAKNYAHDISLKTIAYDLNINAAYLGQLFKSETGQLFSVCLNTVRIENAKKLLVTTALPLHEVSQQCGYTNISYFYNIFKKYAGKTPSEYRRNQTK